MNKTGKLIAGVIVLVVIIGGIVWYSRSGSPAGAPSTNTGTNGSNPAPVVPVSETTKVSDKLASYHNDELGFAIDYPTAWEKDETTTGVTFILPIDQAQVSTIAKLQIDVTASAGKCSFPPVTTIKDRGTLSVGSNTLNMISMSNDVQGRSYFNRMYSLQQGSVCYLFAFSSISLSPSSKNLTGSNVTQAQNNNKAIVTSADTAFTTLVKSFKFVTGPAGVDETKASPAK